MGGVELLCLLGDLLPELLGYSQHVGHLLVCVLLLLVVAAGQGGQGEALLLGEGVGQLLP